MKKTMMLLLIAVLLLTALVLGCVSLAKYITVLRDEKSTLSAGYLYFRSNVLSDADEIPVYEILDASTDFMLSNAQDEGTVTPSSLTYTLTYSVLISGEGESEVWVDVENMTVTDTFAGGQYAAQRFTVSPIVWDREKDGTAETYDTVRVQAKATAPYEKTLRATFCFFSVPMELRYAYDRNYGMLTMTVAVNADAGAYLISWTPGLLPDNADPSGVLTSASKTKTVCGTCGWIYDETVGDADLGVAAGTPFGAFPAEFVCPECGAASAQFAGQIVATLSANTVYRLHFFIPPEARAMIDAQVDALLESGGEEAVLQLAAQSVRCTSYTE